MIMVLRFLFFALIVRPVVSILLGLHVRGREHIPARGPAILAANHNSHLDAMVLMALLPHRAIHRTRPAAAREYFTKNRLLSWFSRRIVGIIPIRRERSPDGEDPLSGCYGALERGEIVIFFPEGTRGEPEQLAEFRGGIAKLAQRYPEVPVVPIFLRGLGKALPKGEALLVPFFVDVFAGAPLRGRDHAENFLPALRGQIRALGDHHPAPTWS